MQTHTRTPHILHILSLTNTHCYTYTLTCTHSLFTHTPHSLVHTQALHTHVHTLTSHIPHTLLHSTHTPIHTHTQTLHTHTYYTYFTPTRSYTLHTHSYIDTRTQTLYTHTHSYHTDFTHMLLHTHRRYTLTHTHISHIPHTHTLTHTQAAHGQCQATPQGLHPRFRKQCLLPPFLSAFSSFSLSFLLVSTVPSLFLFEWTRLYVSTCPGQSHLKQCERHLHIIT